MGSRDCGLSYSVFRGLTYPQASAASLVTEDGDPGARPRQDFSTYGAGLVLRAHPSKTTNTPVR